jgi:hypothetical protein
MTEADLGRWVNRAERGESFVYAVSRDGHVPSPDEKRVRKRTLAAARMLHEKGLVSLVQRREPCGAIAYVAQRTWKRQAPE